MKRIGLAAKNYWATGALTLAALTTFGVWYWHGPNKPLVLRVPGTDQAPGSEFSSTVNVVLAGKLTRSDGQPANLPGSWPQFRGPNRDGRIAPSARLSRHWPSGGPRELWAIDVGDGYAGPAVLGGKVYLIDYNSEKREDALRCLSLEDGMEIWRYAYPVRVKRNHGMSRTVPAVTEQFVVAIGPKCHVVCLNSTSGELKWGLDLVRQYGTAVPQWYAGQCPMIDGSKVVLAPGGKAALLLAIDAETGKVIWQTPNPHGWKMTHSSVMPMEFAGERMYVYCGSGGVVGVSAKDGNILWETTDWKISIATVPSPLVVDDGRIFLSGGYNSGSLMLQLKKESGVLTAKTIFRLEPEVFGATQHTPVFWEDHIYGVRPDGRFVCLAPDGKIVWASETGQQFGLGSFIFADGLFFALNDSGLLRLIEATPDKYNVLSQAQVLNGRESWGPLSLAGGRLLARDLTRLVCLEVGMQ